MLGDDRRSLAGARRDISPAPTAKPRTAKEAAIASARLSSHARRRNGTTVAVGVVAAGGGGAAGADAVSAAIRSARACGAASRGAWRRTASRSVVRRRYLAASAASSRISRSNSSEPGARVELAVQRSVKFEKTLVDVAVGHASVLVMARTSRSLRAGRGRARVATSRCRPASRSLRRSHDRTGR